MSPETTNDIFVQRTENHFNLRHQNDFLLPHIRTVYHGSESLSYLGPRVFQVLPSFKQLNSLNSFKDSIENGNLNCPCRSL